MFDVHTIIESAEKTLVLIDVFYFIVGLIALILAFFMLVVSFSSNIKDNLWELGVLRAIGRFFDLN